LHAADRDIETITPKPLQKKFIDRDLAVLYAGASRDVWLKDKIRLTIAGRTETGYPDYAAKAFRYSPG
jgi:hypothetical protein